MRDLAPPSLGFFRKDVSVLVVGGVTAGSVVSNPSVFLKKVVVDIN